MAGRFENKVAVVTGAASGIGEQTVRMLASEGAAVVATDINAERLSDVLEDVSGGGDTVTALAGDVTSNDDAEKICARAVDAFARLDVLVNCAGITRRQIAADLSVEHAWDAVMSINVKGTMLMAQAALPHMRASGGGSIVNMGSVMSTVVHPIGLGLSDGFSPYPQSKAAVAQFTRDLGVRLAPEGIRVNAVCPGFVDTHMTQGITGDPQLREQVAKLHPMGRFARAEEIANVILFLASDEASFVTGAAWVVDGGYTAV